MTNNTAHWPQVPFSDVVRLNTDRVPDPAAADIERYVGIEHITPGDLRVRSWGLVAEGTTFTNHFRPGQVLFPKRRAYQRKVAVADFEGVCSGDIYVFESRDPAVLLPELLPFICQTDGFFDHAIGTSAGSLSPRTNWSHLAAYEFPLPPIDEQRRLVEVLQAFEENDECLRDAHTSALNILNSAATELLHQGLIEPLYFGQSVILPEAWALAYFKDVSELITYGFTNPMPTTDSGPWMITAKDIKDGYIDYLTARHTSWEAYTNELTDKSRPQIGDVLITKDGTLGRVAIVDKGDVCINQSIAFIRPNGRVTSEFIAWTLRAPIMQWRLLLDTGGSTIKHLYISKIANTQFFIPDLDTQAQITSALVQIESWVHTFEQRILTLDHFRKTFLNTHLNGQ